MKITRTLSALSMAAVLLSSPVSVGAYTYTDPAVQDTADTATAEFAVLMWSKNEDGSVSITGCVPYVSPYLKDYPTVNVLSVFIYKGVLSIPTEINGQPVTSVKGVRMGKGLHLKYVKVSEEMTDISDKAFADDVNIIITEKPSRVDHRR